MIRAAHLLDLRHVVRGVEDRGAALALHVEQDLFHLRCDLRIEVRGRLIEQQQLRIVHEGLAQPDARGLAR